MEELTQILNEDVVYYIKKWTIRLIKQDCKKLNDTFQQRKQQVPIEPTSNKEYMIWIQYMLHYTKNIKGIENDFIKLYERVCDSDDFDELQIWYNDLKDLYDKWYSIKKRYQYSGYYNFE